MKRELKIGIFVGTALVILAVFIFIVGDISVFFNKPGYPLSVLFDSSSGLEKRAVVRMAGVKIGTVEDIRLAGRKAEVVMGISPKFKVPKGSKATLASLGLLGEKYIEIVPGESPNFCQPGEMIEGMPAISFDQMGAVLLSIGTEVKQLGGAIREMIGEESKTRLRDILRNLDTFTADLSESLGGGSDLKSGIRSVSQTAKNLDERVKEVSTEFEKTAQSFRGLAEENRENIKVNLEKINHLITKIEESLEQLSKSLEKINKGEGTLGKLVEDPELYQQAKETLGDVEKMTHPLSGFKASAFFQADFLGETQKLKNYLTLNFWPTQKTFFSAGIVRDPRNEGFSYSAQGGVRWRGFVPRAGIIESSFGAGVDYMTLDDKLMFSVESFDFYRKPQPHFRFSSRYSLKKYFYLVLGIDDWSLALKREVYFGFGLGR